MATSARDKEDKSYRREWQEGYTKFLQRAYRVGQGGTLSSMDLEEGDALPDNASAEIIQANIETNAKTAARVAVVVARVPKYEEAT